ncbi:MAG: hypothetical protein SFW35_04750 [Chitinophagales bacterium]|nr:hypothetical protein [Chitinophagales bacterium]
MKLFTTDLFDLIQSLNKAEKSFIKKESGNNSQTYLELFSDLEKLKVYDEKDFLKKQSKKQYAGNYRFAKHYLYHFILDALHRLYEEASTSAKISAQIHKADVLLSKSLYRQAYVLLEKAVGNCEEEELFALAIECYSRQYRIVFKGGYSIERPELGRELCEKETTAASQLLLYSKLNALKNRLIVWLRKQGNDAVKHQSEIKMILKAAEQLQPEGGSSYKNQVLWQHTMATGYFSLQNFELALKYQRNLLAVYNQYQWRAAKEPYNYVSAINNLIMLQLELGDTEDIESNFHLFEPFLKGLTEAKPPDIAIKAAEGAYNLRMRYGISYDQLDEHFIEQTAKPFLEKHGDSVAINFRLNFHLHMAYYYCTQLQFEKAQEALMTVLHTMPKDIRSDLHLQARIVEMIIHYELGNPNLLPYLMDALLRKAQGKHKDLANALKIFFAESGINKSKAAKKLNQTLVAYKEKGANIPYPLEKVLMLWAKSLL